MPNVPGPQIINSGIVSRLGGESNVETNNFTKTTIDYDYAIGGLPFLSGISNRNSYFRRRYTRDLSPITKAQFDNGQQVGEQSFTGWWLRSQMSFHGGTGVTYSDSGIDPSLSIRFQDSYGVNPWTINQLTLLNTTNQELASANTNLQMRSVNDGTQNGVLVADGTALRMVGASGTIRTYTVTPTLTQPIMSITDDGKSYYVANSQGIFSGPLNGSTGAGLYATTTGGQITLGWQADRLCVAQGNQVFLGVVVSDNLTTKTPTYTAVSTGWQWTCFAGGPTAIYASGINGMISYIYAFALDNSGAVPIIDAGTVVAEMPHGETINTIYGYLQQFLGIATNKGFRIAAIGNGTSVTYGPLVWYADPTLPNNANGIFGDDRFMYVGVNNAIGPSNNPTSGLVRVDLGTTTTGSQANSNYAYAKDINTHVQGNVVSVATLGNTSQMVVSVAGSGVYVTSNTNLETTGWYQTSRVRYNTTEPKLFKYLSLTAPFNFAGTIQISLTDPTGATNSIASLTNATSTLQNIGLGYPLNAVEWIELEFTLTQATATTGPLLNSWQLKALPGSTQQRLFTVPLLLFDHTKDKFGQRTGYSPGPGMPGSAWSQMMAFEALATSGQVVLFQDLNTGENQLVKISDYEMEMLAPPSPNDEGIGGYLTLSLTTIP